MKVIKVSEAVNKGCLWLWYGVSAFAVITLIGYIALFVAGSPVGIQLASIFCMNGLIFCGWRLRYYWNKECKDEYVADRYLWLSISCVLLYVCLQMLNWGLWLWVPVVAFLIFYLLFARDEIRTILKWKRDVKIVWK